MDKFITHAATLPRLYPAALRVTAVARAPQKKEWITRAFQTMNFSFILHGEGEYLSPNGRYRVKPPAVITQWPGIIQKYGPDDTWDELYMVYEAEFQNHAMQMNLLNPRQRAWRISNPEQLNDSIRELQQLSERAHEPGIIDQIDRCCERMIVQSLTGTAPQIKDRRERAIRKIQESVQSNYLQDHQWDEIALKAGFSPASFRRYWNRYIGVPPHKYLISLRMAQSCRYLVETDMDVSEIAKACGFDDPLYFSRCFHKEVGSTATNYRRLHQT